MRVRHLPLGAVVALALIDGASAGPLPMDTPIVIGSVETVCTGIGGGRDDPRWKTYPVRVAFADAGAQYLAGAHVTLSDAAGKTLADFDCQGSWVLFRLAHARYQVSATIDGEKVPARSAAFDAPMSGQALVVLRFLDIPANK